MPIVHINLVAGRSAELKQALARRVTEAVCTTLHVPPEAVRVLLHEVPADQWFVGGVSKASAAGDVPVAKSTTSG